MKDNPAPGGLRSKENARKLLPMLITWFILAATYCGLILIEGVFLDGDLRVSVVTFLAGSGLLAGISFIRIVFPHRLVLPFVVVIATQLVFIIVGSYLRELEFYFYIMVLLVGSVSTMKNFKLMTVCVLCMIFVDILTFIFFVPRLEWLDQYRHFMKFIVFVIGAMLMLLQTYHVTQKDGRSERALTAFSSLLRSTPNLMAITGADNRVLYLSDQMAKFIQYANIDFAVGQPLIDLIADKELKIMFADVLDADGFYETVMEIGTEEELRYFKIISDKLAGGIGGMFIDISDITPMVKNQRAAEEATRSKSNFLATMSHEIRTPMNAILGIAQIQMQNEELPEEYASALEKIYSSGNNLLGIINDILDMSKIETGKMELNPIQYDMPSLINDAVQLNIVRIGSKPIEFILDIDETLPSSLIGDELRLKQILNNLLSNGIKYTESGYVKLSVNHSEEEDGGVSLHFIVEDTGQGMKLEDRDRFFSEYSRFNAEANRTAEGTGLGLSITKKLVEMMDGTIWAESEYGKGSIFMVIVKQKAVECPPIGTELAERLRSFKFSGDRKAAKLQITRELMPYGSALVVDDVETNLYVAKGLLAPYKLKIETVDSGYAAIEKVENGSVYDVIFMDHMMPQMDGIETTQKLRNIGYKGVIVALTANALVGNDEMFKREGFDGFIAKPIDLRQLNAILNTFIRDKQPPEVIEAARRQREIITELPENGQKADAELLSIFARDAKKAAPIIDGIYQEIDSASDDDLRIFVVNVHAMKSALANIGESEASKLADLLEQAGKKKDKAAIRTKTQAFLDMLLAIVAKTVIQTDDGSASVDADPAALRKQLERIVKACGEYDDLAVEDALSELKGGQLSKETKELLDNIAEHILHSNFDKAAEACTTALHLI